MSNEEIVNDKPSVEAKLFVCSSIHANMVVRYIFCVVRVMIKVHAKGIRDGFVQIIS